MSEPVSLLSYPQLLTLDEVPELMGKLVYIVKGYPLNGLAVLMERSQDHTSTRFGNWDGNYISLMQPTKEQDRLLEEFLKNHLNNFIGLMAAARIKQAIFYLSDNNGLQLVDMRTALDRMVGPGMLRDLLSKVIKTQEVVSTTGMTPETLAAIRRGEGSLTGDLIVKPSVFKTITRGENPSLFMYPMYGTVSRCKESRS
jgi:hypothetical protein